MAKRITAFAIEHMKPGAVRRETPIRSIRPAWDLLTPGYGKRQECRGLKISPLSRATDQLRFFFSDPACDPCASR